MLSDKTAVYNLTRNQGKPAVLVRVSRTYNSETGAITNNSVAYRMKRLVRLPITNSMRIVPQTVGGDKPFGYSAGDALFLAYSGEVGVKLTGYSPDAEDYIIQDNKRFTVISADDFTYPGGWLFKTSAVDGVAVPQFIDLHLDDTIALTELSGGTL